MTNGELVAEVRLELNRPVDDDKYPTPQVYGALTDVAQDLRGDIGVWEPGLLEFREIVTGNSDGSEYTLTSDVESGLRVFTPPGRENGTELFEGDYGTRQGWRLGANNLLRLQLPRVYTPGLYVSYVIGIGTMVQLTVPNTWLPEFIHRTWAKGAAADLAAKPGSRINAQEKRAEFDLAWNKIKARRKVGWRSHQIDDENVAAWYIGMA